LSQRSLKIQDQNNHHYHHHHHQKSKKPNIIIQIKKLKSKLKRKTKYQKLTPHIN